MEQKELNKILESHKRWLKGEGGEPADLTWKNLRGKDLAGKDLYGVNFYKTDLYETDLSGADLRRANFENVIGLSVLCIQAVAFRGRLKSLKKEWRKNTKTIRLSFPGFGASSLF